MLENLVGDEAAELARAGDQNPLEADARAPAALEHLAHELARRERQRDVEDEEDAPDDLRHFEGAAILRGAGREVGLHVQRGDDAEDDGENAADEDGEEVVDARAAAPQAVEALQVEAERHQHGDERQHVDVLPQRRNALGDRNQAGVEPERVGDDERRDAEQRVGEDVEGDEQPVVAVYHAADPGQRFGDDRFDLVAEARAAEAFGVAADGDAGRTARSTRAAMASAKAGGRRLVDEQAGLAGHDGFERAAAAERDDRPAAGLRLERHDAEVFFARQQRHGRAAIQLANLVVRLAAEKLDVAAVAGERSSARALGAVADDLQRHAREPARVDGEVDAFVGDQRRHDQRISLGNGRVGMEKIGVDGRIHHSRLAIIVSADPARNIMRDSDIAVTRPAVSRSQRASRAITRRISRARRRPRRDRARNTRRTGPRRSASASGSSRCGPRPGRDDRLRDAVAGADDEVEAVEVELLDERREERQALPVVAPDARQPLQRRRVDRQALDGRRDRARHVEQREELGVGESARTGPRAPSRRRACRSASRGRARLRRPPAPAATSS